MNYRLILKDGTYIYSDVLKAQSIAKDGIYYVLKQHLLRNKSPTISLQSDIIRTVEQSKRNVVLSGRFNVVARRYLFSTKALHISSESLNSAYIAWAVQNGSPLRKPFNRIIVHIREMGLIDYWLHKTIRQLSLRMAQLQNIISRKNLEFETEKESGIYGINDQNVQRLRLIGNYINKNNKNNNQHMKTLSLVDVYSVFLIWSFSMISSLIVFIVEIFIILYDNKKNKKKNNK